MRSSLFISGRILWLVVTVLVYVSLMPACIKEEDFKGIDKAKFTSWNPAIAAPIGSAKLTLKDILKKAGNIEYLIEDPDGYLRVYHRSSLISETAGDLITFGKQDKDTTINIPFPVYLPVGDSISMIHMFTQKFSNNQNDVVDSIRFKQGLFSIEIESMMDHNAKLILSSPGITKNNIPFRRVFNLNYTGTLPVTRNENIDLDGYSFVFDHSGNQNNLIFYVEIKLFGDNNPNPGPFPIKISMSQDQLLYRVLFGQIKTRSMSLLYDVIKIPFFEKSLGGVFRINDPRIGISINNSFGIPVSIAIDPLKGFSDINPPYNVALSGPGLPVPFMLNAPTINQVGQKVNTSIKLNKNNSNIDDFINLLPQKIEYGVEGIINPAGVSPGNFVLDTSSFEVEIEVEIPLEGYASGFTLQDTMEFKFSEDENVDMLEWMLMRVNMESTFPFDASVQVTFLDSNYLVLDSLFDGMTVIIPGALPGPPPDYRSVNPAFKSIDIKVDNSKLKKLNHKVKYMILSGAVDTSDGGNKVVRIYSDNYLKIDVGIQGKMNINPDNLK